MARGLNFAPAPQMISVPNIVAVVEGGLSRADYSQAQLARTKIVGCLARARPPPANLSQAEHKTLRCLREDDSIVAPADKGVTKFTVVMDYSEYEGKIQTLLADTEMHRRLTGHNLELGGRQPCLGIQSAYSQIKPLEHLLRVPLTELTSWRLHPPPDSL